MVNWADANNHGKPLWIVHGDKCFPQLLCAKLRAYTTKYQLLPAGVAGPRVCIFGYSVYRRQPGFRTLGVNVDEWVKRSSFKPAFFDVQDEALAMLRKLTTPMGDAAQ